MKRNDELSSWVLGGRKRQGMKERWGRETKWMIKDGEKMWCEAGYENRLHSDPQSSAPGLSYNTFHRGGEWDTVHGKTKREQKWNQIRRAEEYNKRRCRRTEVVDWVPPEILLFRLFCISLLSLSPHHLPRLWHLRYITTETLGHIYDLNQEHMVCVCVCVCMCLYVYSNAVGFPSDPQVVVKIYFLVHCLLLGHQRTIVC